MFKSSKALGISVVLFVLGMVPAQAGLLGDSVTVDYIFGATKDTVLQSLGSGTVIASGTTFNSFGQTDFKVFDTAITITDILGSSVNFTPNTFNGYRLTNLTGLPAITGLTIDPATTLAGFTASRISFDATHVWVNLSDLTTQPGLNVKLNMQFGASSVPEPATFGFVGLSLASLVLLRRRRA